MKKLLANIGLAMICLIGNSQIAPPVEPVRNAAPLSSSIWVQPGSTAATRTTTFSTGYSYPVNPSTTAEMLESTGEVFVQKNHPGGAISLMRGFGTNRQVFIIDGYRIVNAITKSGDEQDIILLDPYSLSQTNVFFGPGAVNFCSDAIGGIISYETLPLKYSGRNKGYLHGNAQMSFSSADLGFSGHIDLSAGWKKWALVTSFSRSSFNDIVMGSNGPEEYLRPWYAARDDKSDTVIKNKDPERQVPSGFNLTNLMQKVSFKPNDNWEMTYGFYYANTSESQRYDKLLLSQEGIPEYAESYNGPRTWMMNSLDINYTAPSTLCDGLDIRLAYQYFGDSRTDRFYNDNLRLHREDIANSFSVNMKLFKQFMQGHHLSYGMEIMIDNLRSESTEENILTGKDFLSPGNYPQTEWSSYGLYVDYTYKINDKTDLNAGIRYNLYLMEALFDTSFVSLSHPMAFFNNDAMTGHLKMGYRPSDKWRFGLSFSTAFRPPRVDEIGIMNYTEHGTVLSPNTDLKSEYAYNTEASASKIFGNFLKIDVATYFTFLNRAMIDGDYNLGGNDSLTTKGATGPVEAAHNSLHAMVYGIQATLEARFPLGFEISSRLNYQKGIEVAPNNYQYPLHHAAPFFGKAVLAYNASRFRIELYSYYSASVKSNNLPPEEQKRSYLYASDENGDPFSPGWCTLNLRGFFQVTRFLSVGGGIENITDARYRPYGSALSAPGRSINLSVKGGF